MVQKKLCISQGYFIVKANSSKKIAFHTFAAEENQIASFTEPKDIYIFSNIFHHFYSIELTNL